MGKISAGQKFREALSNNSPLKIVGTINAYSALLAEKSGHRAIYLSGGGVAASDDLYVREQPLRRVHAQPKTGWPHS